MDEIIIYQSDWEDLDFGDWDLDFGDWKFLVLSGDEKNISPDGD